MAGHRNGATLRIADNGKGLTAGRDQTVARTGRSGLGLRNMQERVEQLDGTLRVTTTDAGTVIEADVPLSHLLAPQAGRDGTGKRAKGLSL